MMISKRGHNQQRGAFTLLESLFAIVLIGGAAVAMYSAITWCFFSMRLAREDLKATQIMVEKMEVVRLCTWDQVLSNAIPSNFSVPYSGSVTGGLGAPIYNGAITLKKPGMGWNYEDDLRLVTISLNWTNGGRVLRRETSTYISRYGVNKVF